ncbi:hypothetical protein OIU76_020432, partial [Salix suchowensis]
MKVPDQPFADVLHPFHVHQDHQE